jgi:DNA invertase Pin-like site-specific DNA recombinase
MSWIVAGSRRQAYSSMGAIGMRIGASRAAVCGVICAAIVGLLLLVPTALAQQAPARGHDVLLAQGAGMRATPSAGVRSVQRVLEGHGYNLGRAGVDGRFGPVTARAVRRLQADSGVAVDGIVGAKTRRVIRAMQRRDRRASADRRHASPDPRAAAHRASSAPPPVARTAPARTAVGPREGNGGAWLLLGVGVGAALGAFWAGLWLVGLAPGRRRRRPSGAVAPGADTPPERRPAPMSIRVTDLRGSPSWLAPREPVIGYVTVAPHADRREAEESAWVIEDACALAEWDLVDLVTDRDSGRGLQRPGLTYALEQIADGKARGLVIGEVRRLSRSIMDLGVLIEWFREAGAGLVALDLGLDTSTVVGHEAAGRLITLGGWERERIAQRTQSALADVRAGGRPAGPPSVSDRPELLERITAMRDEDMTMQGIADRLNAEAVPTLRGGAVWRPSSVQAALGYRRPRSGGVRDQLPPLRGRP